MLATRVSVSLVALAVVVASVPAPVLADCGCNSPLAFQCSMNVPGVSGAGTYVLHGGMGVKQTSSTSVAFQHNNRGYLGQCAQQWEPTSTTSVPLLGKTISITVDLSDVGCGCNVGMYLVAMPGIGSDGQPAPSSSKDYCACSYTSHVLTHSRAPHSSRSVLLPPQPLLLTGLVIHPAAQIVTPTR